MIRNALLTIILLAAPVAAAAEPPNPMATPAPTPAPKINTDLKVAPGILLGRPKPAACPGAVDTRFTWSSCSGAPGTQVTVYGPYWVNAVLMRPLAGSTTCCGPAFVALSPATKVPNSNGWAYTFIVPPLCYGAAYPIPLLFGAVGNSFSGDIGSFTMLCAKTTAPKPAACPGAKSTDILLSSCSDAPGTHLTLTTTLGKNVTTAKVLFKQNAGSKVASYPATVGRSAGAYTVTVPPLCNGGNASFSLLVSYIPLVLGRGSVSENLGTFTAICAPTSPATGSTGQSKCPGSHSVLWFSSCSAAMGTQVTVYGSVGMNAQLHLYDGETCCGATFAQLSNVQAGQESTFIVPQLTCGTVHLFLEGNGDVGNFTVICAQPAATASPKPTPTASPNPTPTASPKPKPTASHHDN
jgi:hypothetical protein